MDTITSQIVILVIALAVPCPLAGIWIAGALVPVPGAPARGDRIFGRIEQVLFRFLRVESHASMRWSGSLLVVKPARTRGVGHESIACRALLLAAAIGGGSRHGSLRISAAENASDPA